ncbi:MAG: hypothetical protein LBD54_01180 [Puniceicoccales bacterium]|jgi:phosphoglucosamine mutase|nr:hypothetical protein [Puniceicoccales bacterium]
MCYFGTDGIRGTYGQFPMTEEGAHRLGLAVAGYLKERGGRSLLLGRDTRFSGKNLAEALVRGLGKHLSVGDLGILPTPALAMAVASLRADLGVMITASHNPATDNGFKLLGPEAQKLPDAELAEIEKRLDERGTPSPEELLASKDADAPESNQKSPKAELADVERRLDESEAPFPEKPLVSEDAEASGPNLKNVSFADQYIAWLRGHWPGRLPLKRLLIDAAHGATSNFVPKVFASPEADILCIAREPDGHNINAGVGSEHVGFLAKQVLASGADLGIAFDGDGDRCVVCDADGEPVPGDQLLGIFALDLERRGKLAHHRCVATVMSNTGLDHSLRRRGIELLRSDVGDAQVWSRMLALGARFGGEASGHIIFRDLAPGGDGMLTAILLLSLLARTGRPLRELREEIPLFPQETCSLPVAANPPLATLAGFQEGCRQLEKNMGCVGRVFVRYSGTEPRIRLLVEAAENDAVEATMAALKKWVAKHLELV